jgi:hypothetical protein
MGFINLLRSAIQQKRTVHRLFCIATVVLASVTTASAQRDSQRPTLPAVKGVSPPVQEEAPAAPANAPATVRLQFPNSDVVDVLHLYEQLTGKKLVMDNFVQGKVNIFIAKDVSREEAIKIIEISMALNGISLVPAGRDIVDVVGAGQNPRNQLFVSAAVRGPTGASASFDGVFPGKLGHDQHFGAAKILQPARNTER